MTPIRFPFTHYGTRELIVAGTTLYIAFMFALWLFPWVSPLFLVLLAFVLWFFRDPDRAIPKGDEKLLAPADGRVVEISDVIEPDFIGGPAVKVGIFLSVFDVHINRAPCRGKVAYLRYQPGQFKNALRAEAAALNESNSVGLDAANPVLGKVMVKQIAGAIARRIVCDCRPEDDLAAGQKFGMIKLGSRTEVYIPAASKTRLLVKVGDKVYAGISILGVIG